MSSYDVTAEKDSVETDDRQQTPQGGPDLRPTVKLETQAKVDSEAIDYLQRRVIEAVGDPTTVRVRRER